MFSTNTKPTSPKPKQRYLEVRFGTSWPDQKTMQIEENLLQKIPYFADAITSGSMIFSETQRFGDCSVETFESVLQYIKSGELQSLAPSDDDVMLDHTKAVSYARQFVVAHRLGLKYIEDALAIEIVNFEVKSGKPSPRVVEILSEAGLQSSDLYAKLMVGMARAVRDGSYSDTEHQKMDKTYAQLFLRWEKGDLMALLGVVGGMKG
ncbi:hypothetical protein PMZ80_001323 [Knufia obscura]|uniref:BTB/POZ domain-containing protein n=2 Tax=Knufia TaxID=430999 RepID=A0AAN8EI85_9EURO|nr:hypothetical protein PMZ80_001323 [Knufia obscura]KAK5956274.1 hypothetical protein OHC33_002850 [Knufia fluminis]